MSKSLLEIPIDVNFRVRDFKRTEVRLSGLWESGFGRRCFVGVEYLEVFLDLRSSGGFQKWEKGIRRGCFACQQGFYKDTGKPEHPSA